MKPLFILFFSIFFLRSYSQTNDIKYVHFRHHNSMVIDSGIDIYISQTDKDVDVEVIRFKSKKNYKINLQKFLELTNAILKINPNDVIHEVRYCLDAANTEIMFASTNMLPQNTIEYHVSCLSSEDKTTIWQDYLQAVNLILETAKLKFTEIN